MFVILEFVIPLRGETDCHSRLHGFAMTWGVRNGLPQPF